VIGLSPILYGFRNPGVVYFKKELSFHKEFAYEVSSKFVRLAAGIGYALVSPTVWALVFSYILADVTRFLLSYVLHPYKPSISFDREAAGELIDFGKWITASSILNFLYARGDDTFVGWYLSATALGFYQYAYRIADMPSTEISEVIAGVTFPAYSRLQDDASSLRTALLRSLRIVGFATYPLAFGIALVAPSFVPLVLGSEWNPMIPTMQLLALYGLLHSLTRNFGSVWKAIGRPDIIAKLGAVRVACIAVLIWPATARWGIEGTAAVVVGVYVFPMLPLDVYMITRTTEATARDVYREYFYPLVPAATMFGALWYVRGLFEMSNLVELLFLVPAGAVIYFSVAFLVGRGFDWGIEEDLNSIFRAIRS
jgi:PST family polysaccharide transporter/lipopolysaccharide exporter